MKICPVCQASFADSFQYCPHDASALAKYDLRADLISARSLRLTLPEPETLFVRLARALRAAAADFYDDPRGFIRELLSQERRDSRRRRLMLAGFVLAALVASAGLLEVRRVKPAPAPRPEPAPWVEVVRLIAPAPGPSGGGGGGGRLEPTPPSRGRLPQATLQPQIVMPDPEPPRVQRPLLPVAMTVQVDPHLLPPFEVGPVGLPDGAIGPPSSGPGDGDGIGNGRGTGIGPGEGSGVGPGRGFNKDGGDPSLGVAPPLAGTEGAGRPTILYREKARYTEEARQDKVQGRVVLSAFFTADGRVTNIRVLSPLPGGLTEKAIEAAQRIRFQPATRNGAPITVRANLEYHFTLY
jgi:protein TonB